MKYQDLADRFDGNKKPLLTVNECEAVFQPIVAVDSHRNIIIKGFEALAREVMPDGTLMPPVKLLEDIDQAGTHMNLYTHMLNQSCKFMTTAEEKGFADFYVSVNADIPSLSDNDFSVQSIDITNEHGIEPERIAVEVIEKPFPRKTLSDPLRFGQANTLNTLSNMRDSGFKIGLDDFGMGESNMGRFYQILSAVGDSLSFIKYDKTFTPTGSESTVPKAINSLGQARMPILTPYLNFELFSIVEGIEKPDDQLVAQTVFNDNVLMQGYMFSLPLELQQALQVLEDGIAYKIPFEESHEQGTESLEYSLAT